MVVISHGDPLGVVLLLEKPHPAALPSGVPHGVVLQSWVPLAVVLQLRGPLVPAVHSAGFHQTLIVLACAERPLTDALFLPVVHSTGFHQTLDVLACVECLPTDSLFDLELAMTAADCIVDFAHALCEPVLAFEGAAVLLPLAFGGILPNF